MFENENKEFSERLVTINRVAKVVKGGRRFGFAAIMIVGDNKGRVGFGTGKAKEVPEAVRKATENAKTKMIRVHLKDNRTLHHDIVGRFGAGKVILRSAAPGTGIIAGGPMRALFESLGIKDVVAKSTGSSNPHNMIKATFDAFKKSESPKSIAAKRSKKISEIFASATFGSHYSSLGLDAYSRNYDVLGLSVRIYTSFGTLFETGNAPEWQMLSLNYRYLISKEIEIASLLGVARELKPTLAAFSPLIGFNLRTLIYENIYFTMETSLTAKKLVRERRQPIVHVGLSVLLW